MAAARLKPALDFLLALQANNNKPWFQAHRAEYDGACQCFEGYVDDFIQEFRVIEDFEDLSAKDAVFRIYRDVRFSKDKSPYKPNMAASVALGGKHSLRAPYYIHLEPPGKSFLAGGIYMPTPDQLAAIRRTIDRDPARLKAAINSKPFKKYFGSLSGEKTQDAAARVSGRSPCDRIAEVQAIHRRSRFDRQGCSVAAPAVSHRGGFCGIEAAAGFPQRRSAAVAQQSKVTHVTRS